MKKTKKKSKKTIPLGETLTSVRDLKVGDEVVYPLDDDNGKVLSVDSEGADIQWKKDGVLHHGKCGSVYLKKRPRKKKSVTTVKPEQTSCPVISLKDMKVGDDIIFISPHEPYRSEGEVVAVNPNKSVTICWDDDGDSEYLWDSKTSGFYLKNRPPSVEAPKEDQKPSPPAAPTPKKEVFIERGRDEVVLHLLSYTGGDDRDFDSEGWRKVVDDIMSDYARQSTEPLRRQVLELKAEIYDMRRSLTTANIDRDKAWKERNQLRVQLNKIQREDTPEHDTSADDFE